LTGKGIFSAIALSTPPWGVTVDPLVLDRGFFSNYGQKTASPLIESYLTATVFVLTDSSRTSMAGNILGRYRNAWTKKFAVQSLSYKQLENAYLTEQETVENTGLKTDTVVVTDTGTIGVAGGTTDHETNSRTGHSAVSALSENDIFGFNSESGVPSDKGNGSNTGDTTETDERTDTGTNTSTETRNTAENTGVTTNNNDTQTRTHSRSGSIGVITPQQMIKEEIEVWEWLFFEDVFRDVAKMLTIPIYTY